MSPSCMKKGALLISEGRQREKEREEEEEEGGGGGTKGRKKDCIVSISV